MGATAEAAKGFEEFYRRATGHLPYAWQRQLATRESMHDVIEVPTGAGKTQAVICAWLYRRHVRHQGPRRLVYALPMRTLVEQTASVAFDLRGRLGLSPSDLPIHILMGGEAPAEDWRESPDREQILIGTIDMLITRALNRGYAESRFAWPVSFGLLNNDCLWALDEVQLMGPAQTTSAQLDGLRKKLGTVGPCESVWLSATVDADALRTADRPEIGDVLQLPREDRAGALSRRLNAVKTLERLDLTERSEKEWPEAIAASALDRHRAGTRTLLVLNTVERAQLTYRAFVQTTHEVEDSPGVVLVHSRFRAPDRARALALATSEKALDHAGVIIVATQVVEAGIDLSARLLVTEPAPFSSIVQRLGRCNRAGEHEDAACIWIDTGPPGQGAGAVKAAAPYLPEDIEAARQALSRLEGTSLSPRALEGVDVAESAEDPAVLRRSDLLDLFDTSPDLSGLDIDIAPFIREDDDRGVTVFFRQLDSGEGRSEAVSSEPSPAPEELVAVPIAQLGKRDTWRFDYVEGQWRRVRGREVAPGLTIMLAAEDGGYDPQLGWWPKSRSAVEPMPPRGDEARPADAIGSDHASAGARPQELAEHLAAVQQEAKELSNSVGLPSEWSIPVALAAALHDLGKAHPVFQATMRAALDGAVADPGSRLWAKSGRYGPPHGRPFFRHELASALALRSMHAVEIIPIDPAERDLIAYLVAAHHGKVRMSIRPAAGEVNPAGENANQRFAMGIVEGDELPAVETPLGDTLPVELDLACMELGANDPWSGACASLRDDPELGPFRLGYLEALLRVADWRGSA